LTKRCVLLLAVVGSSYATQVAQADPLPFCQATAGLAYGPLIQVGSTVIPEIKASGTGSCPRSGVVLTVTLTEAGSSAANTCIQDGCGVSAETNPMCCLSEEYGATAFANPANPTVNQAGFDGARVNSEWCWGVLIGGT